MISVHTIPMKVRNNYCYMRAVPTNLPPLTLAVNKYEGLSLEEIEVKFGKESAQNVYIASCQGVDLTAPPAPQVLEFKEELVMNVKVEVALNESTAIYTIGFYAMDLYRKEPPMLIRGLIASKEIWESEDFLPYILGGITDGQYKVREY